MKDNISKRISYKEATMSATAVRRKISNDPTEEELVRMKLVAEKCFEPVREHYGKPIRINSFFRSSKLNKAIGGSTTSQHCFGEAIDIDAGEDNLEISLWIKDNLEFDQLIIEGVDDDKNIAWVHVSYTKIKANRNQVLIMKNNKYFDFEKNKELVM